MAFRKTEFNQDARDRMEAQTIMVVGGSGFIGQHVVRTLAARGHRVYATYGSAQAPSSIPSVTWLGCDLRSLTPTESWPDSCHTVIFLAQARAHRDFPSCGPEVFAINVNAMNQTLMYALRVKARRFLYASTGSIYSGSSEAQEQEFVDVGTGRSYYVASKLASEILLGPFSSIFPVIILRLFMPYGIGQKPDMLFPRLMHAVRQGNPIHLHGPEGLRANPVAAVDVAEVCARCLTLDEAVTINVAGPEILTLRQIGTIMGRVLGRQPTFHIVDETPPIIVGSTARLRNVLHWAPETHLQVGLQPWARDSAFALAG
jgi:nucleoside-diphosphate-sugar epimerase